MCDNSRILNSPSHYICLNCEKGFKKPKTEKQKAEKFGEVSTKCPECQTEMQWVSVDFRIPRKGSKIWNKLRKEEIKVCATSSCSCNRRGIGKTPTINTGYTMTDKNKYVPNFNRKKRLKSTGHLVTKQRNSKRYQEILDSLDGVDLDTLTIVELRDILIQKDGVEHKGKLIDFWAKINDISLMDSKDEVLKVIV